MYIRIYIYICFINIYNYIYIPKYIANTNQRMCLMLVLLLTIWGFHALFWIFYSPLCTWAAEQKRLSPVKSHIWAATFVEVSWFDLLLLPLSFSFFCCCFFVVVVVSTLKSMLGVMPVYSQWGLFNLSQRYTVYDISLLAVWKKEKKWLLQFDLILMCTWIQLLP